MRSVFACLLASALILQSAATKVRPSFPNKWFIWNLSNSFSCLFRFESVCETFCFPPTNTLSTGSICKQFPTVYCSDPLDSLHWQSPFHRVGAQINQFPIPIQTPSILVWTPFFEAERLHTFLNNRLQSEKCPVQCNIVPRSAFRASIVTLFRLSVTQYSKQQYCHFSVLRRRALQRINK